MACAVFDRSVAWEPRGFTLTSFAGGDLAGALGGGGGVAGGSARDGIDAGGY